VKNKWNCEETAAEQPLPLKTAVSRRNLVLQILHLQFFFNIDILKYYKCHGKYKGNFYEKKSLSQMIENCLIWRKQVKKNFGGNRQFSAGAAVFPPFLHSSILFSTKAAAERTLEL